MKNCGHEKHCYIVFQFPEALFLFSLANYTERGHCGGLQSPGLCRCPALDTSPGPELPQPNYGSWSRKLNRYAIKQPRIHNTHTFSYSYTGKKMPINDVAEHCVMFEDAVVVEANSCYYS